MNKIVFISSKTDAMINEYLLTYKEVNQGGAMFYWWGTCFKGGAR